MQKAALKAININNLENYLRKVLAYILSIIYYVIFLSYLAADLENIFKIKRHNLNDSKVNCSVFGYCI
jgi:FtsH-binding integral membrane protein